MNKVCLIGRLTKDPDVRYTPGSQMAVARFTLAIDRPFRNKNGEQETDFIRITVFGRQAENCEKYLKKGLLTGVEGRIQTGSYDKPDGTRVFTTDVIADRVEFLEWGDRQNSGNNYNNAGGNGGNGYNNNNGYNGNGGFGENNYNNSSYNNNRKFDNYQSDRAPSGNGGNGGEAKMPDSFKQINEDIPF